MPAGLVGRRSKLGIGPPAVWSPASIAGLTAWYKADSLALADGAAVASWPDSSATALAAAQATPAKQPVFKTAIQNGLPIVRFINANATELDTTSQLWSTWWASNAVTVFFMQHHDATANTCSMFWTGGGFTFNTHLPYSGTFYFDFGDTTGGSGRISVAMPGTYNTGFHVVTERRDPAGTSAIFMDGTSLVSAAVTKTFGGTTPGYLQLGGGSGNFFGGDVGEVIIYNTALSTVDRTAVEGYLKTKWATP